MINRITKVYFKRPHELVSIIGREHWSSGYGDDSCSSGRGFESRSCILDGHLFTTICCKNCIVCLKRPKINKKEAGVGPFKKRSNQTD